MGAAKIDKTMMPIIVALVLGVLLGSVTCLPRTVEMTSLAASLGVPNSAMTVSSCSGPASSKYSTK